VILLFSILKQNLIFFPDEMNADSQPCRFLDPGVKKAPDPGSGTLLPRAWSHSHNNHTAFTTTRLSYQPQPHQLPPVLRIRIRIRIRRIHMFLSHLDPDPDPSIIKQK
jgi:hypothetical protein